MQPRSSSPSRIVTQQTQQLVLSSLIAALANAREEVTSPGICRARGIHIADQIDAALTSAKAVLAEPAIRFERNYGMFNTCHNVQAYRGFTHVGGASYDAVTKDWLIEVGGRDLSAYLHNRAISVEANLTIIENIIGAALAAEQARAA